MSDSQGIKVVYTDQVVHLILDRPKQLNALNDGIRRVIATTLNELMEQPEIRLLVLSGAGASFCSGADLKTTSYPKVEGDWSTRRNRTATWQRVLEQIERIPQVTIASMQGNIIGGGALLATACDFRVISESALLRIPELALGIPNVWNGTPLLAREVGLPTARDWVMTTRKVGSAELRQSGWAQRLAADDELKAVTQTLIDELLAVPPAALALTRSMTSALGRSSQGMAMGWSDADLQQWAFTEEEYKETVRRYTREVTGSKDQ